MIITNVTNFQCPFALFILYPYCIAFFYIFLVLDCTLLHSAAFCYTFTTSLVLTFSHTELQSIVIRTYLDRKLMQYSIT